MTYVILNNIIFFAATYKEFFVRTVELLKECSEQYRGVGELLASYATEDLSFLSPSPGKSTQPSINFGFGISDEDEDDEGVSSPKKKLKVRMSIL
jgi:hypothetical protein